MAAKKKTPTKAATSTNEKNSVGKSKPTKAKPAAKPAMNAAPVKPKAGKVAKPVAKTKPPGKAAAKPVAKAIAKPAVKNASAPAKKSADKKKAANPVTTKFVVAKGGGKSNAGSQTKTAPIPPAKPTTARVPVAAKPAEYRNGTANGVHETPIRYFTPPTLDQLTKKDSRNRKAINWAAHVRGDNFRLIGVSVRDVSPLGVWVEAKPDIQAKVGDRIHVMLFPHGIGAGYEVTGTIKWMGKHRTYNSFGIGVGFDGPTGELAREIEKAWALPR